MNNTTRQFAKVTGGSCQLQTAVASRNAEQAVSTDAALKEGRHTGRTALLFRVLRSGKGWEKEEEKTRKNQGANDLSLSGDKQEG